MQINFQDFNSKIFGRPDTLRQQFVIKGSTDGENWDVIADYSDNQKDMPHAYIELEAPSNVRYVRYDHKYVTNEYLAISEFRVFGKGGEAPPATPESFSAKRHSDRRNADLSWSPVEGATGYVAYWGIVPDKLNLSVLMYDEPNYEIRALNTDQKYYFQVEAFNENGISKQSEIIEVE